MKQEKITEMKTEKITEMKKRILPMNPKVGVKNMAQVINMTLEEYFGVTQSSEVAKLISSIRRSTNIDERRKLKSQLPFRCPHYFSFSDNRRAQASIIPEEFTWQTCVDIDDLAEAEQALSRAYLLNNNEGEWKGMLLHVERSASGKLHIDIRLPIGMTIKEAQMAYTKALGVSFDEDCCSPERMIYITDADSQLFTADGWYERLPEEEVKARQKAFTDRGLTIDGREGGQFKKELATTSDAESKNRLGSQEAERKIAPGSQDYPHDYMGIPYSYIVEELADQLGGTPEHGNRNPFIYTMACHLRHICNDDPQWIKQILPNYGEAQDRVNDTIESACRRNQSQTTPVKVKNSITLARKRVNIENGMDEESLMRQPRMSERMPGPVKLITSKAPKGYHPAIANTAFAAFATYTGGVKAEFWNGTLIELTQEHLLVALMSVGKSSIKEPINHILRPIIEKDKISRAKEKDWAEEYNTKGANKDKKERPKDICKQVVDSDMTNAAFAQILEDAERAGNKAIFTRMDELEQLKKVAGGSTAEVTEILRRDFDTDVYGQERVGTQSVKARAAMRWNIVISTTPNTAKMFLGGNIDNGTLSRLSLSTIVKEDVEHRPMFKEYDEAFDKKLAVYQARLEDAKGTIVCKQAKALALKLLDRGEERALMMGNESYQQLSYRAVEIAFRKNILLYIMNGMKWSKEIEEFITWSFDYDMWVKMCLLGEEISTKLSKDSRIMKPGVSCLLEQLSDSFTRQEFEILYKAQCTSADFKKASSNLLSQWKKRGWIEEDKEQKILYKTEVYYQKHAA